MKEPSPEHKAYTVEVQSPEGKTQKIALTIGNCAVALFRMHPEMDYLAIQRQRDDQETYWTFIFDHHELIYWMGNVALTEAGVRALHTANRTKGTFRSQHGFNPDVVIEDEPGQKEHEVYFDYITKDLEALTPDDFLEGRE